MASADPPSDADNLCTFTAVSDELAEADIMTGYVAGGPVLQNGRLTCVIQVGSGLHAAADNGATAMANGTNGFVLLSPTLVSYAAEPFANVYLCDQFTDSGGNVWVYDDVDGAWEASNSTAECRLAVTVDTSSLFPGGEGEAALSAGGRQPISGTVELSSALVGDFAVAYRNFDPPLSQWTCTVSDGSPSVTCAPQATSNAGKKFLCDHLAVVAEHTGVGALGGSSACAGGAAVTASSGASASDSWSPGGSVPWTCAADPNVVGPWKVTCDMFGTGSGGGRMDHA